MVDPSNLYANKAHMEEQRGLWTQWPDARVSSKDAEHFTGVSPRAR